MLCTVVTVLGIRAQESLGGVFCGGDKGGGGALSTVTADKDVPTPSARSGSHWLRGWAGLSLQVAQN